MSYNKYPKEMKEAIIARMLEGDETVTDIQRDTGVEINTLYRWRDQAKHQKGLSATTKYKNADKWSSQDKFMVVLETANLTEIEFSEYCREKGVYPEQVKEWKEACINANDNAREKSTYLNGPIKGMHYYLYMFSDLYSRKIVGWEVWESEDAKHASELVKRIYRDEKIYIRNMQKEPLVLHSDNGSPMKGTTMLETLYALGITPSKSRPRVSNDNPYAESLFKTLKYVPNFQPQGFATLTEARLWVKRFVEWYNNEHRHSGINYVTPSQRHMGLDQEVLRKRKEVYEKAKERHPERWAKGTRAWSFSEEEWLNPRQEAETKKEAKVS